MPAPKKLEKAELREIDLNNPQAGPINPDRTVKVQFNPETLTVNFSNQVTGGNQSGGSAIQFVGQGTTKLSLDLWFDITVYRDNSDAAAVGDDVRKLTERVNYFMKPNSEGSEKDVKWKVPAVRFLWGTFIFDGVMNSINEKLEYFSEDGKPLRAMLSIGLLSQMIQYQVGDANSGGVGITGGLPGVKQMRPVKSGDSIQKISAEAGLGDDWRKIAEANGIENPRIVPAGTLLDLRR